MPNGIITEYEVNYEPTDSSQPLSTMNTGLETSFVTDSDLELGMEFNFSVRAFTAGGGAGEIADILVSTLTRPCKKCFLVVCIILYLHTLFPYTAAVKGVMVTALNDTSVYVSWNAVIIPDSFVDFYTVVYSPASQRRRRQDGGEMSAVFPGTATSGVMGGLDPATDYKFQVFATVTVDGVSLEGERSISVASKEYIT